MEVRKPIRAEKLRKVTAAAAELKVTRLKIYQLIESNELDYISIGESKCPVLNQKYEDIKNGK